MEKIYTNWQYISTNIKYNKNMAITSFIKPIDNDKGIFYTFQSARHDMSSTFNKNFRFSKFALLHIPDMGTENDDIDDGNGNIMQFLGAGESLLIQGISSTDYNKNLAESFQNYCLNLEAALINKSTYNPNLSRTVTERVFWKWLKEMGAIRYRKTVNDASDEEKDYDVLGADPRYVEKNEFDFSTTNPTREYNRVVKYIGDVELTNSIKGQNAYTEIYIHVPTWVGNMPYVLFETTSDVNYEPNMTILNSNIAFADEEYLVGRYSTDTHPFALSTLAFYDLDDIGAVDSYISNTLTSQPTTPGRWFTETTNNAYYTDTTFSDASEARIYRELAADNSINVDLIRNYLDGVIIDWDINNYWLANQNEDILSFADLASYTESTDFEYNAILLYYDILNPTTGEVLATNLFGIQFLNQVTQGSVKWSIPDTRKYMPDTVNLLNGNSYAYKFNLKFDAYNGSIDVEKSINDYNTLSMDLYLDVLNASKDLTEKYSDNLSYITSVKTEIDALKRLFIDDTNKNELLTRIEKLENSFIASTALFENTDSVMKMITELYDKITSLTNTETFTTINEQSALNLGIEPEIDFAINPYITLQTGNNYVRSVSLQTGVTTIDLISKLRVYINDTKGWTRGQSLDVVFTGAINPGIYSIEFVTDIKNRVGSGEYGIIVGEITDSMLDDEYKGHYRFICNNQDALTFYVDKIN